MAANTDDTADVKAVTPHAGDMAIEGTGAALDRGAEAPVSPQDDGSVSAGVAGVVRSARRRRGSGRHDLGRRTHRCPGTGRPVAQPPRGRERRHQAPPDRRP